MFHGFRWQLIALLLALMACAAAAVFRISRQSMPPATATAPPQIVDIAVSESPPPTQTAALATDERSSLESDTTSARAAATFSEGLIGGVQRINPLFAHLNPPARDLASLIFEGLFATIDYGEAVPRLAAELLISNDGLEYVVRLRDDIKWQDGVPFSADDVVYTLSLLSAAEYADFFYVSRLLADDRNAEAKLRSVALSLGPAIQQFPAAADRRHLAGARSARHVNTRARKPPLQSLANWYRTLPTRRIALRRCTENKRGAFTAFSDPS